MSITNKSFKFLERIVYIWKDSVLSLTVLITVHLIYDMSCMQNVNLYLKLYSNLTLYLYYLCYLISKSDTQYTETVVLAHLSVYNQYLTLHLVAVLLR